LQEESKRIYFIDAIRAFAILMMLQGHFVSTLLAPQYRDRSNWVYVVWEYFRGVTAPVFFTITGFVFVYLLIKKKNKEFSKARIKKGIKRALKLILWGYALHLSFYNFTTGVSDSFFNINVLQIIGASILLIISLYLLLHKKSARLFQYALLILAIVIFLWERYYVQLTFAFLPDFIANWFTKANGSIFTLFPWFGYVAAGGFLAIIFKRKQHHAHFYKWFIYSLLCIGIALIAFSSFGLLLLHDLTGISIFKAAAQYNYLFTRMGDVMILFAVFALFRKLFEHKMVVKIGSKTLSIYIIHFIILYGSFTGIGLSRYFYASLTPMQAIIGAALFLVLVCIIVLQYYKYEAFFKAKLLEFANGVQQQLLLIKAKLLAAFGLARSRK
jgi:uncharacterized membrane protein